MKRFIYITLLIAAVAPCFAAVDTLNLCRPAIFSDNWGNCYWQFVSTDGTTRWQFNFDNRPGIPAEDVAYSLNNRNAQVYGGYSYGFIATDTLMRIEYDSVHFQLTRDEANLRHVAIFIKGSNQEIGRKTWRLFYDEAASLPVATDTIPLNITNAEMADYRASYNNFRFSGATDNYHVSVTINHPASLVGDFTWSDAEAIGSEIQDLTTGQRIPVIDLNVQVQQTASGHKMTGHLLGQNGRCYAISLDNTPKPVYQKVFITATDYNWTQTEDGLQVTLYSNAATGLTFQYVITSGEMGNRVRHSIENGELNPTLSHAEQADGEPLSFDEAFIWGYHNNETGTDVYTIEADAYCNDMKAYILSYAGVEKELANALETILHKVPAEKILINGQLRIIKGNKQYDVLGR